MLKFKYKNKEYTIFFYHCDNFLSITEENSKKTRICKYDKSTSIKHFLNILDKLKF